MNPVIAVLLGWLLLAEPITGRTLVAMALILGAVIWIQLSHKLTFPKGLPGGRGRPAKAGAPRTSQEVA